MAAPDDLFARHRGLPIVDYHCHLPPERIASDRPFSDLAELWLDGDHYKWRAMRGAGVPEELCSGRADGRARLRAFARVLPLLAGGPLPGWCRRELALGFGLDTPLTEATADAIWEQTAALLATAERSPRGLLRRAGVEALCTTDDPADDLAAHRAFAAEPKTPFRMVPTFRPDAAMHLGTTETFTAWVDRLARTADRAIGDFRALLDALHDRAEAFAALGCRVSDHGLERAYPDACGDAEAAAIFGRLRAGRGSPDDLERWRGRLLREFAEWDHARGWTMLLHLGARRNNTTRIAAALGLDAGCDSIGDFAQGGPLVALLDRLDAAGRLPATVLFNSNPRDTLMFVTIAGSFFEPGAPGKVQVGPPWWFLDQADGIAAWLEAVMAAGVLGVSLGMVTDSRSFVSTARHDYFREVVTRRLEQLVREERVDPRQVDLDGLCLRLFHHNARDRFGWTA